MDSQQVLEEAGVDEEKLKEAYKEGKKILPKDGYTDIIRMAIDTVSIKPENINLNKTDKVFSLQFENEDSAQEFEEQFNIKIMPSITKYINDVMHENPKSYQRTMVLETNQEGISFNIYY